MRISRSTHLAADVEEVFAVLATEEHQLAKVASEVGRSEASVTVSADGAARVRTSRSLPTRDMPSTVSSVVGDTLTVTEDQTWRPAAADGRRTAALALDVAGAPVRMRGTISLAPDAGGSLLDVDADLTCSLPFVGRKIEAAAKPTIEESFDLEVDLLRERLG